VVGSVGRASYCAVALVPYSAAGTSHHVMLVGHLCWLLRYATCGLVGTVGVVCSVLQVPRQPEVVQGRNLYPSYQVPHPWLLGASICLCTLPFVAVMVCALSGGWCHRLDGNGLQPIGRPAVDVALT
jgi:hypothetical protein